MDEIIILELHFSFIKKKEKEKGKRKKGGKRSTHKVSSLGGRGIVLSVSGRRKGASVVLNIHVL